MRLDGLKLGHLARVLRVEGTDGVSLRLMEMGLTPGVEVRFIATAPLGDPLEYELRGYRLSLRRSEASRVEVEPLATPPEPPAAE
jgi:ferrous iron transport protein A